MSRVGGGGGVGGCIGRSRVGGGLGRRFGRGRFGSRLGGGWGSDGCSGVHRSCSDTLIPGDELIANGGLCICEEHALDEDTIIGRRNSEASRVSSARSDFPVSFGRALGKVGRDACDLTGCEQKRSVKLLTAGNLAPRLTCALILEVEGIEEKVVALCDLTGS